MAISHNALMGAKESIEIAAKMLQLAIDEAEGFEKVPQGGGDYDPPIPVPEPEPEPMPEPEPVAPGLPAGYLAKNFKLSEFRCKCGGKGCNGYNGLSEAQAAAATKPLAELLQKGRDEINRRHPLGGGKERAVNIVSGYRCAYENKKVSGEASSRHVTGIAADVSTPGIDTGALWDELNPNGGVGYGGKNCPHVDTRGYRSRWKY
ncbi:MAG: D-Ala-D-Ala carboxypeptidase family metallohydrolase [Eubacteriaceae bacterium]|nr:D-Ala-D-Ala carboxypeptidase family metallohydrolase [Eubacteriaceae bacterium]